MTSKAIFFDRDGTLIRDAGYVRCPAQVKLVPGAAWALSKLRAHQFLLIVISNQSGIHRGLMTREDAARVDQRFQELLAKYGVAPDRTYYCPHVPSEECKCRKPSPGLLFRAANELTIDLASSWMLGDKRTDIEAGRQAGCHTLLIRPPGGLRDWQQAVRQILNSCENMNHGWGHSDERCRRFFA